MDNLHTAVIAAEADINTQIGVLSATFAPIPQESFGEKLALDILAVSFALVVSPFWNICKFRYSNIVVYLIALASSNTNHSFQGAELLLWQCR
jgi:hypothetical protein